MGVYSCYGCVPPKRTPTCKFDGSCDKYAKEKERHDREKAVADQRNMIQCGLTGQMLHGVNRANRAKRRSKGKSG